MSTTKGVHFFNGFLGGAKIVFGYKAMKSYTLPVTSIVKIPQTKTPEQNRFHYSVQQYFSGSICSDGSTNTKILTVQ